MFFAKFNLGSHCDFGDLASSANRSLAATMWRRRPSAKLVYKTYNYRVRPGFMGYISIVHGFIDQFNRASGDDDEAKIVR